jgi:hypothetical protein
MGFCFVSSNRHEKNKQECSYLLENTPLPHGGVGGYRPVVWSKNLKERGRYRRYSGIRAASGQKISDNEGKNSKTHL